MLTTQRWRAECIGAGTGLAVYSPDGIRYDMTQQVQIVRSDVYQASTTKLRLNDKVIGAFNVESERVGAFSDEDRQFAEMFSNYIALALHILDLLVVERCETGASVTDTDASTPDGDEGRSASDPQPRAEGESGAAGAKPAKAAPKAKPVRRREGARSASAPR
mgnify:CR=1 FL=1